MIGAYARRAFPFVSGLFALCSAVQIYLAGLGVFDDPSAFVTHREFGYTFGLLLLVMLVLAAVGRMGRRVIGITVLIAVLFALQSVFVALRTSAPVLAALHPL